MIQNSQCSYSKVGEKFKIKSKLIKLSKGDFFSKTRKKWHESKDVNFIIIIIIARSIFYLALITNQNCQIVLFKKGFHVFLHALGWNSIAFVR